jgi:hypothetical protein
VVLPLLEPTNRFASEGSSLGSLLSACAVSRHPAVTGIEAEPPGAVP